jgi:hypothetical protein
MSRKNISRYEFIKISGLAVGTAGVLPESPLILAGSLAIAALFRVEL